MSNPDSLADLLQAAPRKKIAVILPDAEIQVTYGPLREQVMTMADALVALGTAAPLNPGYRQDEFNFYLENTSAKLLLDPPGGAPEASNAAEGKVPVHLIEAVRPIDLEAIGGAVVELGERLGVPMPHTRSGYACTKLLDRVSQGV